MSKRTRYASQADAERHTRDAIAKGAPVPNQPGKCDLETDKPVGTGPKGGVQTKVRVHIDSKGQAHSHPAGQEK